MAVQHLTTSGARSARHSSTGVLILVALFFSLPSLFQTQPLQICQGVTASLDDPTLKQQQPAPTNNEVEMSREALGEPTEADPVVSASSQDERPPLSDTPSHISAQDQPSSKPNDRGFTSAPNARQQAGNNGRQAWAFSALPPELAADATAPIKRPFDLLRIAAALFGDSPWLLTTDDHNGNVLRAITYKQGHALAASVGAALDSSVPNSQLPQRDGANEPLRLLGTWAANSVELVLSDFGAGAFGVTVVPVHPDMNTRRFLEVMIHTQMTHLCTDWRHLEMVLDLVERGQLASLSTIISLDAVGDQAMLRAQALELTLVDFWDLTDPLKGSAWQKHQETDQQGFGSADIHAVLYPRALSMPFNGAMLSNENMLASLETLTDWRVGAVAFTKEDRVLCADSLASIHQRVINLAVIQAGAAAAFAHRGLLALQEDVAAVQPTVLSAAGGILPMLHAAARRTLKRMGRLRRFMALLKLRWRARSYWRTGDVDLLAQPPFQELKKMLASTHTLFVAPALASSELIKELQLLYSVIIVHACCSAQTGVAFSTRQQNDNSADPTRFQRIRAAPLGWASPVLTVALEKLSASDEAGLVEFHADGVPGRRGGSSPLILDATRAGSDRLQLSTAPNDFEDFRRTVLSSRRRHEVTEGEVVIQGACVSVGYYRHQTAFQRQLTTRGMYRTGLVAISAGADFPLLMVSALSRNVLTAAGEFIDIEEAERQIKKVPIVRRVLLYADDFHSPLVAIIQPRKSAVIRWAKRRFAFSDDYGGSYENLVSLPALRDFVLKQIEGHTWLTLDTFERPKAIYLVPHDVALPLGGIDEEPDHKQGGFTILRRQLAEAYAKPIREMYASLSE